LTINECAGQGAESECDTENKIRAEGAQGLAKALESNRTLTKLNLESAVSRWCVRCGAERVGTTGNDLGAEGMLALVKAFEFNGTLVKLNVDSASCLRTA
jgi:hypothetical protein